MSYLTECLQKFNQLPADIRTKLGSESVLAGIFELEKKFNVDIKHLVLLVSVGEVEIKDIPVYLSKKNSLSITEAVNIKRQLLSSVFSLAFGAVATKEPDIEETIREIFQQKLIETIKGDNDFRDVINEEIIITISSSEALTKSELLNILLQNQERLPVKSLVIDGKNEPPTISNWIKEFIKIMGSGLFNNIMLSQYFINSENARKLGQDEKMLLNRVLTLYRNLKFFPESMGDLPVDQWQIFPLDEEDNKKDYDEKYRIELKKIAEKYPPGSLERLAVEEEIKKLEVRS
jgi:hypothetical protein